MKLPDDFAAIVAAAIISLGIVAVILWGTIGGGFAQADEDAQKWEDRLVKLEYGNTQR